MTGLPFVWAFWAGRPGALPQEAMAALLAARDQRGGGVGRDRGGLLRCRAGRAGAGVPEGQYPGTALASGKKTGLRMYYELAGKYGLVDAVAAPAFYHR